MKNHKLMLMIWMTIIVLVGCSGSGHATYEDTMATLIAQTVQSFTPTPVPPSPEPTETSVPTATPTEVLPPTPTRTKVPFKGFMSGFSLYNAWNDQGKTYFYFLQSDINFPMYARADSYNVYCNPDPKYPIHMICVADEKIFGQDQMTFEFFTDESRQDLVFTKQFYTGLVDDVVWDTRHNCPDRGKNVTCESEYRLYDGRCYYAHTCYDACGPYYSRDNLPDVWTEFQGYTTECN